MTAANSAAIIRPSTKIRLLRSSASEALGIGRQGRDAVVLFSGVLFMAVICL